MNRGTGISTCWAASARRLSPAASNPPIHFFLKHGQKAAVFLLIAAVVVLAQAAAPSIPAIESFIRSGDYDHALEVTKASLQTTPKDFRLWTLQGIAFSLKNESVEALKAFDRALGLAPWYVPALKGKIQLLYRTQDARAIPVLEQLLELDTHDETAHEMLATLEAKKGNCRNAIENFQDSENAVANHPGSLELYGYCLQQIQQTPKAIAVFQQLSALLPQQTYPRYDLAVLLVETRQNDAALKALAPLLAGDHPDPDALSLASQAYESSGDTPKAVATLRQAIVLDPANPDYYTAFALLCLDHDSYQVGIAMLDLGLQQIPRNSSLYVARGLLYAQLAEYEKAEADFKAAEKLDSAQSLSSYAMDLADLESKHPEVALAKVRTQLKAHPDSAEHHFLLAKLLENDAAAGPGSARTEAVASARKAVLLKPDFVAARDLLANLYINSGEMNLAREQCELALKDDPLDQTAIYHLIVVLRHSASSSDQEQIKALIKRLADVQRLGRERDANRKRFHLVEEHAER
jgi:tetratricopeptide (TPR) repeat protein